LRVDNWRNLANVLEGSHPNVTAPLLDEVLITGLRHGLDEMANEQNPLGQWPKSPRHRRHEKTDNPGPLPVIGP